VTDLIDTTEMYLRTIFELEEEGVPPLRARIAERLNQSGPTVSQTVARMARDGLLDVGPDRQLELTALGRTLSVRVMRKHRLAECLLVSVVGLPWEEVHAEACRWEHVMSEAVERRLLELLDHPTVSPFGNPIPGLAELGAVPDAGLPQVAEADLIALPDAATPTPTRVLVARIGEPAQADLAQLSALRRAGVVPGAVVKVQRRADHVLVGSGMEYAELELDVAAHILVQAPRTAGDNDPGVRG